MWREQARELLENLNLNSKSKIIAIVGAGASVASGLKTFRGIDGHYKGYQPEELASRHGFSKDPLLVWQWYKQRIEKVFKARPNDIHYALKKLEEFHLLDLVITQNVDGLHRIAGHKNIVEIHGNILQTHCFNKCGINGSFDSPPVEIPVACDCGSFQRPSVVWFGERIQTEHLELIQDYLLSSQLVLIIGTSGYVYPTAQFPIMAKHYSNSLIVEFNTEHTVFNEIDDLFIQGPAEETLPDFVDILISLKSKID